MDDSIISPAPPNLEGVTWQSISRDDLMAVVELAEECWRVDGGLAFLNVPENLVGRVFPDAPGAGIGAFADKGLAAYVTVHLGRRMGTERAFIVGQVHPDWRRKGIGDYLMRWSEGQAETLLTAAEIEPRLLQISTESLTETAEHLYHVYGFEQEMEELVMQRDLQLPFPDHPLPPDVKLVTWQPDLADQFYQAYHAAFRDRPGFPGYSAEEWIADRIDDENAIFDWSLLALSGKSPVGFVNAGTEHPGGYIVQIGVVPEYRRRGLASALMVESMRRMKAAGESSVQLCVNLNNPGAERAYVQLGFETVGRRARYERVAERSEEEFII